MHADGRCDSDKVGLGTRVWAFAHVLSGAVLGSDCNVCGGAFIEGGVVVGNRVTIKNQVMLFSGVSIDDDVFLGPGVIFTNDRNPRAFIRKTDAQLERTHVRQGATIGAGAVIVCGIDVGPHAFISAGAVVVRDVPAHGFVVGNPGRMIGWACRCGLRLPGDLRCSCGLDWALSDDGLRPEPPREPSGS